MTDQTLDPPPPGDTVREDWLRAVEEKSGPGMARIFRTMEEWRVYEIVALRYYHAIEDGWPPPDIADGVERYYARQMGEAVADLQRAIAEKDPFWEKAYRSAVSRIHSAIHRYKTDRDARGLPIESSPREIDGAASNRPRSKPPEPGPR